MDIFKHAIEPCKKTEQCRKNKDWHQETFDRCFQRALVMAEVQNKQLQIYKYIQKQIKPWNMQKMNIFILLVYNSREGLLSQIGDQVL